MRSRFVSFFVVPSVFLAAFSSFVQAAVQNRIAGAVSGSSRVALPGNVSGHARRAVDLGPAPSDLRLESMSLRFSMTAAQEADLNQLLAAQLDPSSPSYHQWLTPEQFGARFGLSSADLAKVSSWLTSQGFSVTSVARSSTFITFSGTVAQAQQAFGTQIHSVSLNGEQHISNLADPTFPSSIAGVVSAVIGLDDFKLKPRSRRASVTVDPAHPLFTQTVSGVTSHYIAPADFYTIYDVSPLTTSGITGAGVGHCGSNTTTCGDIAVMGQTQLVPAQVTAFRTAAGFASTAPPIQFLIPGSQNPGVSSSDIDEAQLDVEWSGAAAQGATILFVYSTDAFNSLTYAIDNKVAPILTISYGLCESSWGTSVLASDNKLLAQANAQGQTVMAPTGDAGGTDCDVAGVATEGLNLDFPGSSPYVTAAGGTMFSGDVNNSSTYWNSTNGTNGGSAIKYIPEQPWNETASGGLDAGGAGGGGASAFFSKPTWQTGIGVPNDSSRDIPDVSLNAAAMHDGYLVCSQNASQGESGCTTNSFVTSTNVANVFGGTSFVAPSLAGILALVEQKLGTTGGLGNIGPTLYGFLNGPTYTSVFNDIITGNNSVPCSQGTLNCPSGGSIGFNAGTGYDLATGIGSFDVSKLVNGWSAVVPVGTGGAIGAGITTTLLTTNSAICGVTGNVALSVSVTGGISGTTPTGTVQIFVDNVPVTGGVVTLSGGTGTYSLVTSTLSSGGHVISAVYSGDGNYGGSKGTLLGPATNTNFYPNGAIASVDVVSGKDFGLTPCIGASSAAVTVQPGATAAGVTLTFTPANGFTGTVTLTAVNNDGMTATTTFTPTSVNVTTGAVTASFVVKASQTSAGLVRPGVTPLDSRPSGKAPWYAVGSGATLACLLLLMVPRRRRWGSLLAAVLAAAALTAALGCGSSSSNSGGSGGGGGGGGGGTTNATAGTYSFTITAVSGTLVHSTQVTVTVP